MDREQRKPGNYLVFDGGRSALSALYITEEIFERLQYDLDPDNDIRVGDHCDLLSGTSSGAVAAILLGRMQRTPSQAIKAYLKLESALSARPTKDEEERRRNTDAFKRAFTEVLEEAGFTADSPMLDKTAPKTVVWTLNATNISVLQPIRTYRVRGAPGPPFTILEAACASVASPDRFIPTTVGAAHQQIVLIDARAGYANPTKEALQEAQRVFDQDAEVASIVSLGAGKGEVLSIGETGDEGTLIDAMAKMALDSEQVHKEVHTRLHQSSVYFRLNVERGLIGCLGTSSVHAHTSAYMQESNTDKLLNEVVESIKGRQKGSNLKDINSVTALEIKMKPRPSVVENFVGRDDILDALSRTHLSTRPQKAAVSVLMGLGGSGKTQIALKFALEYEGRDHNTSVYFFDASSEDKLKADFELAIRARDSISRSKSHDDALIWFASRNDNWLIIMDNADDPSVELFHFIPKSSHGNVIITTRNSTYKTLAPNGSYHVEGLASSEAVELILRGASYEGNEENKRHAQGIAEALGHFPLALAHAAGYISVLRCLPTYLDMFRNSQANFLASKPTLPQDYKSTIAATLELSLDSVPQAARHVMMLLAGFDVSSIAQSIFVKSAERQFRHIDGRGKDEDLNPQTIEQANILMSIFCSSGKWLESDFNEIIKQCLQYSLLQVSAQGSTIFYSMHVLVQTYLQSKSASIRQHQVEQLVVRLLGSAITVDHNYKYHTFNRLLSPHLKLVAFDHVVEAGDHLGLGHVLREQGNARLSTEHFERCLVLRRMSLGDEHHDTVLVMNSLALSYRDVGRHREALKLQVEALDLRRRLSGEEHPETLRAMDHLALSYWDLGRHREALELGVEVLDLQKRISGDEHPETLYVMGNLTAYYWSLGRHREALELGVEVLDLRKRLLGDEHPETLRAMGSLASFYHTLGKYRESLELEEEVVDLRERLLGDEHPETLRASENLASSYHGLGRYQEALELEEKVLDIRTRLLGKEHPDTLFSMRNLSVTLHRLGRNERAIALMQIAAPLHEKAVGMDHPRTIK